VRREGCSASGIAVPGEGVKLVAGRGLVVQTAAGKARHVICVRWVDRDVAVLERDEQITITVVLDHVEEGWVASSPDARATAQGNTRGEALDKLVSLIHEYPELLDDLRTNPPTQREVSLIAV
jgi:predicted RNase H-like HicB family nuclease